MKNQVPLAGLYLCQSSGEKQPPRSSFWAWPMKHEQNANRKIADGPWPPGSSQETTRPVTVAGGGQRDVSDLFLLRAWIWTAHISRGPFPTSCSFCGHCHCHVSGDISQRSIKSKTYLHQNDYFSSHLWVFNMDPHCFRCICMAVFISHVNVWHSRSNQTA